MGCAIRRAEQAPDTRIELGFKDDDDDEDNDDRDCESGFGGEERRSHETNHQFDVHADGDAAAAGFRSKQITGKRKRPQRMLGKKSSHDLAVGAASSKRVSDQKSVESSQERSSVAARNAYGNYRQNLDGGVLSDAEDQLVTGTVRSPDRKRAKRSEA